MKFLLDAQLSPALARGLEAAGHDAQTVRDVGLREAEDGAIWAYAEVHHLILLTKDEDFVLRAQRVESGPVVVWLRVGNSSNRALCAWLEPRFPGIVQLVAQGSSLIEVI